MIVLVNLVVLLALSAQGAMEASENDTTATHYLVKDGQAKAQIVVAPNAPPIVMLAAKELRDVIWKMSGCNLPVSIRIDENIPFRVFVGRSRFTDAL